jgi:hypothetical protein
MNPAAIGRSRGFFAGATYAGEQGGDLNVLTITLVDSVTSPMGGALQYLYLRGDEDREDLSLGLSAGRHGLWWGFTARYVHGRDKGQAEWEDVGTGDVGILFERPSDTRIGVVGYNLIGTSLEFIDRRVALGISQSGLRGWNLAADLVRNFDRDLSSGLDLHLGAEYRIPPTHWDLRFGQMWRGDNGKDYASVGFGWSYANVAVAYGLQKARQASEYLHVFTVDGSF